jgi:tRNA-specific 2-thiouridylase
MTWLYGDSTRGGEWAAVSLQVDRQRILAADAPGLAREIVGLTLLEAAAVGGETLAVDALANAIGPVVAAAPSPGRTAVAMSGGVDSAMALLEAGEGAIGVTLRLWIDPQAAASERACCSPASVITARETCHRLGRPHVTLDLREAFRAAVVEPYIRGYTDGQTPNPCGTCNGVFRFAELLQFATRIGANRLATGHYARIVERADGLALARGTDPGKDQSYMLATLDRAVLETLWFPLGEWHKTQTRARAAAAGLAQATSSDSQEACFLGGDDYRLFLARHGLPARTGALIDEQGHEIGRHDGYWRFTPGQRRGLRVAASQPLYALEANARTNTVTVGPRAALARSRVRAAGRLDVPGGEVEAKLRHRSPAVAAHVTPTDDGFELELAAPAYGVARGQNAVLYDRDVVVGAGVIVAASG